MKILAIGDFHGKFPSKLERIARKYDLILSTGDFGGNDELLKIIFKYFYENWWEKVDIKKARKLVLDDYNSGKKIIDILNKLKHPVYIPIYTIHGNWDFEDVKHKERTVGLRLEKYSHLIKQKENIHFLNKRIINLNGIKLYAFGGMVTASVYLTKDGGFDEKKKEKHKKEHEKLKQQLFSKGCRDIDIMLTHYPPYGYFDVVRFKGENPMNGKHIGFKPYTQFIRKYQPRLFICGHMHEYQGMKKLGKTIIVSTGSARDGKAAIIDYPENKREKININFIK